MYELGLLIDAVLELLWNISILQAWEFPAVPRFPAFWRPKYVLSEFNVNPV